MQIVDDQGDVLYINAHLASLTIRVKVNDSDEVWLTRPQVQELLPSLRAANEALEEAYKVSRKNQKDNIKAQILALQEELAEIEAL
jgi:hypothetical protein